MPAWLISTFASLLFLLTPIKGALGAPRALKTEVVLQKLTMVLWGEAASSQMTNDFRKLVQKDGFDAAYRHQIAAMMADKRYWERVSRYHTLFWQVDSRELQEVAAFILGGNRPYRELYLRDYLYIDADGLSIYRLYGADTITPYPAPGQGYTQVFLAPSETRFRGLFGSPEFLRKFPDTPTNKNRKRSSHAFRIGFCETLTNPDAAKDVEFPEDSLLEGQHGSNPDCIGCHRRLDPMARFFDNWQPPIFDGNYAEFDNSYKADGSIHLGGLLGMDRSFPGIGTGDLGAIVINQPEFRSCVAKLAWQMVFDQEVPFTGEDRTALEQTYLSTERYNDLITQVLMNPYFWSDVAPPSLKFNDVSSSLKICAGCHARNNRFKFDPAQYPFASDPVQNAAMLKKIFASIVHSEGALAMPPQPIPKLDDLAIKGLSSWIQAGARGDSDQPTLTDEQIEEILR